MADIFDALEHIQQQSGKHFDPRVVELILQELPAILQIKERWAEE